MSKIKNKKITYILIVALALVIMAGGVYAFYSSNKKSNDKVTQQTDGIKYSPATQEEKQQAKDNKERIVQRDNELSSQTSSATKNVTPTINAGQYGDQVELGGSVTTIFENGGKCSFTLSQGNQKVARESTGTAEGKSTYCPLVKVAVNELPSKGTWYATLSYSSQTSSGVSQKAEVVVK